MVHGMKWSAVVALLLGMIPAADRARAEAPTPGTVKTLQAVSVVLNVGSTERQARRVVYAPPPGWYVRSHEVVCTKKYGLASYAVNTVPGGWGWSSDDEAAEASRAKVAALGAAYEVCFGGQGAAESDQAVTGRQHVSASHHALVVEVAARGAGFLRGGAGVELTVRAELVYLGAQ